VENGQFVVAPGVYDALGACLAEQAGFSAVYMSGLAVTASLLARPDLELLGMEEMVRQAGLIASAVRIPVIGIGGIASAADALEFLIAGCRAVQIGTANFVDPGIYERILADLRAYLERHGATDVNAVVGTLEYPGLPRPCDDAGTGKPGGCA